MGLLNILDLMSSKNKVLTEFKNNNFKLALKYLEEIIKVEPDDENNYNFKGIILQSMNRSEEARQSWFEALKINPKYFDPYFNLGNSFMNEGNFKLAKENYEKAITNDPNNFNVYFNLGHLHRASNENKIALKYFEESIKYNQNFAPAFYNIGSILNKLDRKKEAINYFEKAIEKKNNYIEAYYALGINYRELKYFEKSKKYLLEAFKINPNFEYLKGALTLVRNNLCDWQDYEINLKNIESDINNQKKVITPWITLSIFNSSDLQKKSALAFVDNVEKNSIPIHENNKKINLGYFSANFSEHAVSNQISEVFKLHNKNKFKLFGFYFGNKSDEKLKEIKSSFDEFLEVSQIGTQELIQTVKNLKIDIAVDLMGYTNSNRFSIFNKRCAPIQVSYLGYAGTTGLNNMDYIIGDKHIIHNDYKNFFTEKIIYMPNSFMPNNSKQSISDTNYKKRDVGLPEDSFVYCCFNKHYKITPQIFDLWIDILNSVNKSVLWLNSTEEETKKNLFKYAEKKGLDPNRIYFTERSKKYKDYLAKHKVADVFLDTSPFSAHSTGCASLLANVPIVAILGKTFASNVSTSLLKSMKLEELIAKNNEGYKKIAIELGKNNEKLRNLKKKISQNILSESLFNSKLYTENLEEAFTKIYNLKLNKKNSEDIFIN